MTEVSSATSDGIEGLMGKAGTFVGFEKKWSSVVRRSLSRVGGLLGV